MNKRCLIIPLLIFIVFSITLGYAYLSKNLTINGTHSISKNTWDVHFTNVSNKQGVTPTVEPSIIDNTSINYSVNLAKLGDYYEFTVDVVNSGSIDAMIDVVSNTLIETNNKEYSPNLITYWVKYIDNSDITKYDLLKSETTNTIKVHIEMNKDIDVSDLPSTALSFIGTISLQYVQAEDIVNNVLDVVNISRRIDFSYICGYSIFETEESSPFEVDNTFFNVGLCSNNPFNRVKSSGEINELEDLIVDVINIYIRTDGIKPEYYDYEFDISKTKKGGVMAYFVAHNEDEYDGYYDMYIVSNGKIIANANSSFLFANYTSLKQIDGLNNIDISLIKSMRGMFAGSFKNTSDPIEIDISDWDISHVTDTYGMFYEIAYNSTAFEVNLSNWNTSSVTDMSHMFENAGYNATIWNIGDLSRWDTSKVANMSSMFFCAGYNATTFELDLSGWDTSNVIDMSSMFSNAGNNATTWNIGDLSNWNTSSVTDMSDMFMQAGANDTNWNIGTLSSWNTSNVTNMSYMFYFAGENASTIELDLSSWDTSHVTNMWSMFEYIGYNAGTLNLGDLSSWNVSKVTDMTRMFAQAGEYANTRVDPNISGWNVSKDISHTDFTWNIDWITPPTWIN